MFKGASGSSHPNRIPLQTRWKQGQERLCWPLGRAKKRIFRDFRERNLTAETAEENRQGVAEKKG
ncbi:MAG: hypothetical protein ACOYNX_08465, partial [Geothrix sp.]